MATQFKISEDLNKSMVTSKFRASYAHVLQPWTGDEAKPPKYSVQAIFQKNDPWLKQAKETVKKIAIEAFGPNAIKLIQAGKLRSPFRDGDTEFPEDPTYQGMIFFNANGSTEGKKPPGLYDQHRRDIRKMQNPEQIFFSGVYARAEVKFYPYDQKGGKGIACFLFRVQLWETGVPLAGGKAVEEVFDEIETADSGMPDDDDFAF